MPDCPFIRYGMIATQDPTRIAVFLPDNYAVIGDVDHDGRRYAVIAGRDKAGWTLDGYVLPRLASGCWDGKEIDLSHPIMKRIPA